MRALHKLYTKLHKGHRWLPCPVCRRAFGTHEKGQGKLIERIDADLESFLITARNTCPKCPGDHFAKGVDRELYARLKPQLVRVPRPKASKF